MGKNRSGKESAKLINAAAVSDLKEMTEKLPSSNHLGIHYWEAGSRVIPFISSNRHLIPQPPKLSDTAIHSSFFPFCNGKYNSSKYPIVPRNR